MALGARFAFNSYKHHATLIIRSNNIKDMATIYSCKGVIHGVVLAMLLYGLALIPLIKELKQKYPRLHQPWYADDSAAAGRYQERSATRPAKFGRKRRIRLRTYYVSEESSSHLTKIEWHIQIIRLIRILQLKKQWKTFIFERSYAELKIYSRFQFFWVFWDLKLWLQVVSITGRSVLVEQRGHVPIVFVLQVFIAAMNAMLSILWNEPSLIAAMSLIGFFRNLGKMASFMWFPKYKEC